MRERICLGQHGSPPRTAASAEPGVGFRRPPRPGELDPYTKGVVLCGLDVVDGPRCSSLRMTPRHLSRGVGIEFAGGCDLERPHVPACGRRRHVSRGRLENRRLWT